MIKYKQPVLCAARCVGYAQ